MKAFAPVLAIGALGFFAVCDLCQSPVPVSAAGQAAAGLPSESTRTVAATAIEHKSVVLRIEGMTCGGCAVATRRVVGRLPGVSKVEVSYQRSQAVVTYDPAKVSIDSMIAAVRMLGYTAGIAPN